MMLVIFIILTFIIAPFIWLFFFIYKKEKYERIRYSKNNILDYDIDKNGLVDIYPENEYEEIVLPYIDSNYNNSIKYTDRNYIRNNRQRNNYNKNIHNNVIY